MTGPSLGDKVVLFKSALQHIFESKATSSDDDSWKQIFCRIAKFASKISGVPFDPSVVESLDKMKEFGERCIQANPKAISSLVYANEMC
ncbi:MAG: hypothetical protein ACTSSA_05075 [Candidatus Freyarchaeota archaeon]